MYQDHFLQKKLNDRIQQNAFRQLRLSGLKTDFCSNDYLGIAKKNLLSLDKYALGSGSTGSRLLSGNYPLIEAAEREIALFHQADAALIFNSGYDANLGLIAAIAQRGDVIIYDQLSHASIRDGIRLSFAQSFSFIHNDLNDLEKKLQHHAGAALNIFIVTESVFSMDGDLCPLQEMVALCRKYKAHLIIDEAHATGVIGESGAGLVQQLQLQNEIFCRMHTFGKACGCHGAVVLGSQRLKSFLINFARSFIYSTSLPPHAVAVIQKSYEVFPHMVDERRQLNTLIHQFQNTAIQFKKLTSQTPIQVVLIPGNEAVKAVAAKLQARQLDVRPILYPTVPKGKERLRIVLHAFNTKGEVEKLTTILNE